MVLAVGFGFGPGRSVGNSDGDGLTGGCGTKLGDQVVVWENSRALGFACPAFCAENVETIQALVEVGVDRTKVAGAVRFIADMAGGSCRESPGC